MEITPDQRELQDLVRRFLSDSVPAEYLRKRIDSGLRRDEALVESLKALGLEEGFSADGGVFSFAELALVAEEVGRALLPEPLLERLFCDLLVPSILSGETRSAYMDLGGATAIAPPVCCKVKFNSKSKRISGEVAWGFAAEGADRCIGVVSHDGGERLFACSLKQAGVSVVPVPSLDLTASLGAISFRDARVVLFSPQESGRILDLFEVLTASEVYGVSQKVVEMSSDYLKTREQFGVPVGAFQAVQQRLADAYAQSESLGALSRFAAWSVGRSPEQLPLTARAAISLASEAGPSICETAIQVHGGIGFTWEYDLHLYLRRAKVVQAAFPLSSERVDALLSRALGGAT